MLYVYHLCSDEGPEYLYLYLYCRYREALQKQFPDTSFHRAEVREKALESHAEKWFMGLIIGDIQWPVWNVGWQNKGHPAATASSHDFWECLVMLVVCRVPLTWEQISFSLLIHADFKNEVVYLWALIPWENTHGKLDSGPPSIIWWLIPVSLASTLGTILQNSIR